MKVYVTGYGLRPFRIEQENSSHQFRGSFELPENVERTDGEKWVKLDYWFLESEITK